MAKSEGSLDKQLEKLIKVVEKQDRHEKAARKLEHICGGEMLSSSKAISTLSMHQRASQTLFEATASTSILWSD